MVWSKESAKAGTVGELSEGSHGWLDRHIHEETWIKLKNMQIYELNDDSSLHQLKKMSRDKCQSCNFVCSGSQSRTSFSGI